MQDFHWHKAAKSPNWELIDGEDVAGDEVWEEAVAVRDEGDVGAVLGRFGIGAGDEEEI